MKSFLLNLYLTTLITLPGVLCNETGLGPSSYDDMDNNNEAGKDLARQFDEHIKKLSSSKFPGASNSSSPSPNPKSTSMDDLDGNDNQAGNELARIFDAHVKKLSRSHSSGTKNSPASSPPPNIHTAKDEDHDNQEDKQLDRKNDQHVKPIADSKLPTSSDSSIRPDNDTAEPLENDNEAGRQLAREFDEHVKKISSSRLPDSSNSSSATSLPSDAVPKSVNSSDLPQISTSKTIDTPDEEGQKLAQELAYYWRVHPQHCPKDNHIPKYVLSIISNVTKKEDSSETFSTQNACQQVLDERAKLYVGNTTAFLPAMKRCMIDDDVQCYETVMKHFTKQNQDKPWRLKQLPALAAQLGASNIFKELSVSHKHPLWNKWMTRAAARGHIGFIADAGGPIDSSSVSGKRANGSTHPQLFYSVSGRVFQDGEWVRGQVHANKKKIVQSMTLVRPKDHLETQVARIRSQYSWIDESMTNPMSSNAYPTAEEVLKVLNMTKINHRAVEIEALKRRITKALSGGVYLMDDILESPQNLVTLWWHFGDQGTINDDGRREAFIKWLMDEGAPMDLHGAVEELVFAKFNKFTPSKTSEIIAKEYRAKLDRWIATVFDYSSGSGTNVLITYLQQKIIEIADRGAPKYGVALSSFQQLHWKFGADILDPKFVKLFLLYWAVSKKRIMQSTGEGYSSRARLLPLFFAEHGLQMSQVDLLRAYVNAMPKGGDRKRFLEAVNDLDDAVQGVQKTRPEVVHQARRLFLWGVSLLENE